MISRVMIAVGVAKLKAKLSEYLVRVRAGDDVLITEHGRPIAKIVPVSGAGEHLGVLEREGLVRVGSMKLPKGFLDAPRPRAAASVTDALLEERREGR
jgi:prevent-host-death family protein